MAREGGKMHALCVLALLLALSPLAVGSSSAQTVKSPKAAAPAFSREVEREKANENRITLMAGALGGPYLHLADDIAVVVNAGDDVRVLPTISSGAVTNVKDVLLLKGVDLGITTVQILNALKAKGDFGPNLDKQIAYIAPLSVDTLHILAAPGINSVADLAGKRVAFNLKGSGTARFGPGVLKSVGVDIGEENRELHMSQGDAIQAMRNGDIAATLCSCPIPIPAHAALKADSGFNLLAVPYVAALERDYVPANLSNDHYPNLIAKDRKIETIATSTILITFNWAPGTERYRRIERFVNSFFSNADKLRQPPRHPVWKQVNIGANIRGWHRFPAAQQWLDGHAPQAAANAPSGGIDVNEARAQAARAAPHDAGERERLFKEFLEWSRQRARR
jgi:TRAP transporter TAXI family solute receptor